MILIKFTSYLGYNCGSDPDPDKASAPIFIFFLVGFLLQTTKRVVEVESLNHSF